jgi:hypothetical protein
MIKVGQNSLSIAWRCSSRSAVSLPESLSDPGTAASDAGVVAADLHVLSSVFGRASRR